MCVCQLGSFGGKFKGIAGVEAKAAAVNICAVEFRESLVDCVSKFKLQCEAEDLKFVLKKFVCIEEGLCVQLWEFL